jgi:hypothetical protein
MPRVRISVEDIKCIRQADSVGRDDVYWIANLRSGQAPDPKHTNMMTLAYDEDYVASLPELVTIAAGEAKRFNRNVVYDKEVRAGSYLFGTIHFLERDLPRGNFLAKIAELLAVIIGSLVAAAVIGFAIGYWLGGMAPAIGTAILAVAAVALVGFLVGALLEMARPAESDAHLGGMRFTIGPLAPPPPNSDSEKWQLSLTPSGKLEVVDAHGAELIVYESSHHAHGMASGHRYEATVALDITGGNRGAAQTVR